MAYWRKIQFLGCQLIYLTGITQEWETALKTRQLFSGYLRANR
ncbi:hypothetical protein ACE1B6_18425 [Aerosakkonemataceae cyanobacterium BLCC-F154]|uniref:Uncharacterized protein n=1 Tax=Floridaenema fluviatile BLCC-F154 TaxID=3153640 RepID=A0ABV4YEP3_9CYAN